jgi:Sulfotransferase domain
MALPNFLIIGAQRSGTTLLHKVLDAHPEVFVPSRRKEIHYFDRYYDRGTEWYSEFFPSQEEAASYRAVGEVTPDYIFYEEAPGRILDVIPDCRLIVSLRNPVDRAFSGYMHHRRSFNERRSFEDFLDGTRDAVERGFYYQQLTRYLESFPRSAFLILIYEELVSDPASSLERMREFLGLTRGWSDAERLLAERINAAPQPRFPAAFYLARRFGAFLRYKDLDPIVETVKRLGLLAIFGQRPTRPRMTPTSRARLEALYDDDIRRLEHLLQRDLRPWWQQLA